MARPRKEIDLDLVKKLGKILCTHEEIASILNVSHDTLTRSKEFCVVLKNAQNEGRASLRRRQYQAAMEGNPTMLVWLGKQYLGQKDKQEITGKDGSSLVIKVVKVDGNRDATP